MKALLSWDVDAKDPEFQRIIFDMAAVLPPDRTQRLTTWTALIDPVTMSAFRDLARRLEKLADRYQDRLFFTLSLQPAGAVVWGRWHPQGSLLLASDDSLGFGPGTGIDPEED